jgi:hypothetical protein
VPAGKSRDGWTPQDIELAKAHCTAVLRGIDAVMTPEDPIKEGECGSPVVFRVTSVSKAPAVELTPPVTLSCDMVAALDRWMKRDVQPKARALLGGSVIRIDTMSSYSCRNAYGRTMARLSEHGKANAIDIAGFATAKETTTVLAGWGLTNREVRAIAARKEAERAAAAAAQSKSGALPQTGQPGIVTKQQTVLPGLVITQPVPPPMVPQSGLGLGPQRLGGPKGEAPATPPGVAPAVEDNRRRFLHDIHAAACKIFGTVLGPEANNAHKNHFHLDMAQRQRGSFCE